MQVDGGCGSSAGALFVPFLAGGLGVAFSLPFLVAILKREKESKTKGSSKGEDSIGDNQCTVKRDVVNTWS